MEGKRLEHLLDARPERDRAQVPHGPGQGGQVHLAFGGQDALDVPFAGLPVLVPLLVGGGCLELPVVLLRDGLDLGARAREQHGVVDQVLGGLRLAFPVGRPERLEASLEGGQHLDGLWAGPGKTGNLVAERPGVLDKDDVVAHAKDVGQAFVLRFRLRRKRSSLPRQGPKRPVLLLVGKGQRGWSRGTKRRLLVLVAGIALLLLLLLLPAQGVAKRRPATTVAGLPSARASPVLLLLVW